MSPTSGTYASAKVGTGITVTAAGLSLSGTAAGNYKLDSSTISGAIGTITPKTLTATLTGTVSKVYDGTTTASLAGSNFNFSSGDVIGSDVVTLVSPKSGTYASVNAGTGITVTATGLSLTGAAAGNYTLAATSLSRRHRHHHPEDVDGDADRYGEQGLRRHDHRQPRRVELRLLLRRRDRL